MDTAIEDKLSQGVEQVKVAFSTEDSMVQQRAFVDALRIFKPISIPEAGVPSASYYIGVIFCHMAIQVIDNKKLKKEVRISNASKLFDVAEKRLGIAADMQHEKDDLSPVYAKDLLRNLPYIRKTGDWMDKEELNRRHFMPSPQSYISQLLKILDDGQVPKVPAKSKKGGKKFEVLENK